MFDEVSKDCGNDNCSKKPSYGVMGSRKAEFCAAHASSRMTTLTSKKCGNEGCFKYPSYGVEGSRKREFCAVHARLGMVNVSNKKCGNEGCSKVPSYGGSGKSVGGVLCRPRQVRDDRCEEQEVRQRGLLQTIILRCCGKSEGGVLR
ncbi:unnamed protein product [Sphacelaria rigidula]